MTNTNTNTNTVPTPTPNENSAGKVRKRTLPQPCQEVPSTNPKSKKAKESKRNTNALRHFSRTSCPALPCPPRPSRHVTSRPRVAADLLRGRRGDLQAGRRRRCVSVRAWLNADAVRGRLVAPRRGMGSIDRRGASLLGEGGTDEVSTGKRGSWARSLLEARGGVWVVSQGTFGGSFVRLPTLEIGGSRIGGSRDGRCRRESVRTLCDQSVLSPEARHGMASTHLAPTPGGWMPGLWNDTRALRSDLIRG